VPGAAIAADQAFREADLAIDHREDVVPLPEDAVAQIVSIFEAAGARAKVSSIHVNGWIGDYDKLTMSLRLLEERFGTGDEAAQEQVVFVGDSPNDAPMFAHFVHSVGVANVHDFAGRLPAEPAWVTEARGGAGFAELAAALLEAR
jgi:hydroxymethylpyrimidine pyrophosphatase-like HAD family hydrolase